MTSPPAPAPSIVALSPSGDVTGTADTAAVSAALASAAPGSSVQLGPGDWFTSGPLQIPTGVELAGVKGGINGASSKAPAGTVIHPVAAFSAPGGVLSLGPDVVIGARVRDLAIVNDLGSPADVDGIACHGNVNGLEVTHVSVALVTGHGVAFYQDSAGVDGDGLWMSRCMFQSTGKSGVYRPAGDANLHNVHVQLAGQVAGTGGTDGHGFFTMPGSSGNTVYVGCRADLCAGSGWFLDHKGSFGDATKLIGCSTERNSQDGVRITNSSADGTGWRSPVIISGCCFEGDGMGGGEGGEFAGIRVQGRNRVFIDGTAVVVNTLDTKAGAPKYALGLDAIGSAPGQPETVEWASGRMNYSTKQRGQAIKNPTLADHLLIGPTVTQAGGYESTAIAPRTGQAVLAGGTVTVTSPWALPGSLIFLTNVSPSGTVGALCVSARAAGSFTIASSSRSDASAVAWMIT
jgi:hypothetical protein